MLRTEFAITYICILIISLSFFILSIKAFREENNALGVGCLIVFASSAILSFLFFDWVKEEDDREMIRSTRDCVNVKN